ncbi:hypothetical protein GJ496_008356 [Pomphorhynchus laevis]|nr:hypothetical protein GJ496_008356 [Pomphorhynchus laevis]
MMHGWSRLIQGMDKPFWRHKEELSCEFGIVMWLQRIVIPKALRCHTLSLLQEGHPGESVIKSLSRYYIWWPTIDKDIEDHVATCFPCKTTRIHDS